MECVDQPTAGKMTDRVFDLEPRRTKAANGRKKTTRTTPIVLALLREASMSFESEVHPQTEHLHTAVLFPIEVSIKRGYLPDWPEADVG